MPSIRKILLLTGYFMPTLGYIENGWAKTLVKLGIETKVVARPDCHPKFIPSKLDKSQYRPGKWEIDGYELERVPLYLKFRSMAWPINIKQSINDFKSELVISFGIGQLLPNAGVKYKHELGYKLICIFGDNPLQRPISPTSGKLTLKGQLIDLAYTHLKKPLYYKAIKTADLIGYTKPITYEILKECSSKHFYDLNEKIISIPLGYDSDIFYYSSHIRERKRSQLTYHKDDFVLVYVSKIEPRKQIKLLLDSVIKVMNVYSNLKLILVGFLNDRYDRIIKEYILKSGFRERFTCLPLLPRTELNEIYNAADLGVWHSLPTTTIIEALGTGLTVIVPDDLSFSTQYLPSSICQRFNAYDYNELTDILIASVKNVGALPDRISLMSQSSMRDYNNIVKKTINRLLC